MCSSGDEERVDGDQCERCTMYDDNIKQINGVLFDNGIKILVAHFYHPLQSVQCRKGSSSSL